MNQIGLFDICRNRHRGNPESETANIRISRAKSGIRERVLEYIRSEGIDGATCSEIEEALKLSHQTASARCAELKKLKLVAASGKHRATSSGSKAAVLRVLK